MSRREQLPVICARFRATLRGMLLRWGLARLAVGLLLLAAALMAGDYLLRFSSGGRATGLALLLLAAGSLLYFELLRPLRRKWTDREVLGYLDRTLPGSEDSLVTLAELSAEPGAIPEARSERGRAVLDAAVQDLDPFVEKVRLQQVFRAGRLRRWELAAVLVVAGFAAGALASPGAFGIGIMRLLLPFANIRWPQATYIDILRPESRETVIAQGAAYTVRAAVRGRVPEEVRLVYRSPDTRREIRETMKPTPQGRYEFTFPEVAATLSFWLEGGDERTDRRTIRVIPRPTISKIVAAYEFPAYSRVPPKRVESGQIAGLEGTKVVVLFTASKPLRKAAVAFGEGQPRELKLDSPTTFRLDLTLERDDTYSVHLEDTDGLTEPAAARYAIRVTPDQPPDVRLGEPGKDLVLTAQGRTKLGFVVTDDFGLTEVQLLYRVGGQGEFAALSDRITGPVAQGGKESSANFTWDLARMEGLKAPAFITYFVRAKDCNPSGKGVSDSGQFRIDVLTPLDYQTRLVLEAKRAVTEARLAEQKQRWAWYDARKWLGGGIKDPEKADELLAQALTYQDDAGRAVRALDRLLLALREDVRSNRLETDLFIRRLDQVSEAVRRLAGELYPAMESALEAAKPKSTEEARPEARRRKLRECLASLEPRQRLAAVRCRENLHRLLDWNDLQGVIVQTRHLEKEQDEIHGLSETRTKPFIGKEIEDLSDADARFLEQVAQRQSALCQAEAALEEELQKLIAEASRERRAEVSQPLFLTFKGLKDNLINNLMRKSGEFIADNKSHMILGDQLLVIRALRFINQGLERAGAEVRPPMSEDLALRAEMAPDERLKTAAPLLAEEPDTKVADLADIEDLLRRSAVPIPDEPRLETVERYLQDVGDLTDALLERAAYLDKRLAKEMPGRYRRLRLGWLQHRHARCVQAAARAQELSAGQEFAPLRQHLTGLSKEVEGIGKLLAAGEVGRDTQDLAAGVAAATRDIRRFLFARRQRQLLAQDREKAGGKDDFDRDYLLAGADLSAALQVMEHLGWARVLQADLARKARLIAPRPEGAKPPSKLAASIAAGQLTDAEAKAAEVLGRLEAAAAAAREVRARQEAGKMLNEKSLALLAGEEFRSGLEAFKNRRPDPANPARLKALDGSLQEALAALTDLCEERVVVETKVAAEPPPEVGPVADLVDPVKMTPEKLAEIREQFLKDRRPEAICKRIEENESLPEPVRRLLLETLRRGELDPKYEMLLSAYFLELAKQGK